MWNESNSVEYFTYYVNICSCGFVITVYLYDTANTWSMPSPIPICINGIHHHQAYVSLQTIFADAFYTLRIFFSMAG